MVPPRPKTYSRLRDGRNHAVCVHPFQSGAKWGITLAPSVGNYLGPATGEFTLVLMACIGDIPWPSTTGYKPLHCHPRVASNFLVHAVPIRFPLILLKKRFWMISVKLYSPHNRSQMHSKNRMQQVQVV